MIKCYYQYFISILLLLLLLFRPPPHGRNPKTGNPIATGRQISSYVFVGFSQSRTAERIRAGIPEVVRISAAKLGAGARIFFMLLSLALVRCLSLGLSFVCDSGFGLT